MNFSINAPLLKNQDSNSVQLVQLSRQSSRITENEYHAAEEKPLTWRERINQIPTFNPDNLFILMWRICLLLLVMTYFYLIPVFMFFGYDILDHDIQVPWLARLVVAMIILFIVDIIVNLNTGYYDKGLLVVDKEKIQKRYLTEEFGFDIISVLALILQLANRHDYDFLVWVPFLFYAKLYFVLNMDEQIFSIVQLMRKSKAAYQIIRILLSVLFIVHLFACLFYGAGNYMITTHHTTKSWLLEAGLQNDIWNLPMAVKYEYAFYWSLTTMLTVGYGDISGKNPLEIMVSIVTMMFACVIFAILINAFQQVFSEVNQANARFEQKMTDVNRFMRDKNIDDETQHKVRRFYTFIESQRIRDFSDQISTLNQLGPQLRDEVIMQAYGYLLRRIYWVAPLSYKFQKKMAYLVTEVTYSNAEVIFSQNTQGEDDDALYYVSIGQVNLQINFEKESLLIQILEKDSLFGEIEFLTGQTRVLTAQCTSITQLYKFKRSDFLTLAQSLPLDSQYISMLREKILFKDYSAININCYTCYSTKHLAHECPKNHYHPAIKTLFQDEDNQRQLFHRNQRKTLRNLKQIQQAIMRIDLSDSDEEVQIDTEFTYSMDIDKVANFASYFPEQNLDNMLKKQRTIKRLSKHLVHI